VDRWSVAYDLNVIYSFGGMTGAGGALAHRPKAPSSGVVEPTEESDGGAGSTW
jgi:hypothetical protein